ncbi:MAG TPA: hypothetical protein VL443_01390 [Cyclobacteriaceae bacterium]|nr:hypothetical protein [Cyclobacteriaceae bacterium]
MIERDEKVIDLVEEHIIRALVYYDIFNYPLTSEEVFRFLGTNRTDAQTVTRKLLHLAEEGRIYHFSEFFSIQNEESLVPRRIKGNAEAKRLLTLAQKQAALIARFPFVRAVMGSGSLSKNYMDDDSDLDFFIVTEPGRLWIARMLLVMYKRIFLANSHKYFCINYFVDTQHLEIEEKNLFTATELATVIPLYGAEYYKQLCDSNQWLLGIFPNYTPRPITQVPPSHIGRGKKFIEGFINLMFARQINTFFMNMFSKRVKRIYQRDYPAKDFQVAFKTKDYASKNHPRHYQRKVMDLYEQRLGEVNMR